MRELIVMVVVAAILVIAVVDVLLGEAYWMVVSWNRNTKDNDG